MTEKRITVDFLHKLGRVSPVAGLLGGPLFDRDSRYDFTEEYKELGLSAIRLADAECGAWGFLDLHNLFPDISLDETSPLSYNFSTADKLVLSAHATGAELMLRIGETPEPYEVKNFTRPPRDLAKYARIAEKIVAHYNKGFADGYKLGIKYIEITSSPDDGGFAGDAESHFELYRAIAEHLKTVYPKLRVGGCSFGGFSSLNRLKTTERERAFVLFTEKFLALVGKNKVPLDFFSWKCRAESAEELSLHARYADTHLNHNGLKRAESIISEFSLSGLSPRETKYPAVLSSSLITAEKSGVSMLFLGNTHPNSDKCPVFTLDDGVTKKKYASYAVIRAFSKMLSRGLYLVETSADCRRELYSLASTDGNAGYILLATGEFNGNITIFAEGAEFRTYTVEGILGGGERGAGFSTSLSDIPFDGKITLRAGKYEVYFISLFA